MSGQPKWRIVPVAGVERARVSRVMAGFTDDDVVVRVEKRGWWFWHDVGFLFKDEARADAYIQQVTAPAGPTRLYDSNGVICG